MDGITQIIMFHKLNFRRVRNLYNLVFNLKPSYLSKMENTAEKKLLSILYYSASYMVKKKSKNQALISFCLKTVNLKCIL